MAEGKGNFLYFQSSLSLFGSILFGPMPMIKEIEILLLQPYLLGFGFISDI